MQDVPVGTGIPLVLQIGKWRRQITLPEVLPCQDNPFDDPTTFRLPRTQSEGNLPHIALASGACDPMECLVYRMGVDRSEFTDENGTGRVHYFYGHGAGLTGGANHTLPVLEGFSSGIQDTGWENSGSNGALSGWYVYGGDGWVGDSLIPVAGAAIEGSYFSNHYSEEDKSPIIQEFFNVPHRGVQHHTLVQPVTIPGTQLVFPV